MFLCPLSEGAEFVNSKDPLPTPNSFSRIKHCTAIAKLDGKGNQQHQRA